MPEPAAQRRADGPRGPADHAPDATTATGAGGMRHARFRPLLLAGSGLTVLPALIEGPAPTWVTAAVAAIVVAGAALYAYVRVRPVPQRRRDRLALAIALTAAAGWLVVLGVDGYQRPEAYLLLGSALICALSSAPSRGLRLPLQAVAVVAMTVTLMVAGRPPLDVAFPVLLLATVALVADLYATELVASRRAEVSSRADVERRAELLQAVGDLPSSGPAEAMAATVRTLRDLGFEAAGIALVRDHVLEPAFLDGIAAHPSPQPRGEGLASRAIEHNRTVVTADYPAEDDALPERAGLGSAVVAPIRVGGRPAGVVIAGRAARAAPDAAAVEVAEVLADNLGGILDMQRRMQRQRELLHRMAELDRMRTGFVMAVSGELRDPLTVIRGVGQTLVDHPDDVDTVRRHGLLERMCAQTADLRRTIDALLDFSRFQAERDEAKLVVIGAGALLAPVVEATGAATMPSLDEAVGRDHLVEVDAAVIRHAIELLLVTGGTGSENATLEMERRAGGVVVWIHRDPPPSALVRSLAGQLLVLGAARLEDGPVPGVWLPHVDTTSRTLQP